MVALGGMFLSLFGSKVVGIEMMSVIQLSFLCLISFENLSPPVLVLNSLFLANGYNQIETMNEILSSDMVQTAKALHLSSDLIYNYNFSFALILVPFLSGIICLVIYRCLKSPSSFLDFLWQKLLGEYTFTGMLFCAYLVSTSLIL